MNASVSVWSMVCMGITALLSFSIPVLLCIWFRKKKHADLLPFFIGMAVMLIFALVAESLVHQLVLGVLTIGKTIMGNIWLYALYGGLCEAAVLLGTTMISNIVMSVMLNHGLVSLLMKDVTPEQMPQALALLDSLTSSAPYTFLLGVIERIFAVIMQISLSVIVWFGANRKGKWMLYPLAILLHLAVDGTAVVVSKFSSVWVTECVLFVLTLLTALFARVIWNKYHKAEGEEHGEVKEQA